MSKPVVMKKVEREEAAALQQVSAAYKVDFDDASYQTSKGVRLRAQVKV